jgi:hypothetical protein
MIRAQRGSSSTALRVVSRGLSSVVVVMSLVPLVELKHTMPAAPVARTPGLAFKSGCADVDSRAATGTAHMRRLSIRGGKSWRPAQRASLALECWPEVNRRSGRLHEAQLGERGDPVVKTNFLEDLAVQNMQDRRAGKPHLASCCGGQRSH